MKELNDKAKPLSADELLAGGWWCEDYSYATLQSLRNVAGIEILLDPVGGYYSNNHCYLDNGNIRLYQGAPFGIPYTDDVDGYKRIHRIGNEFYWSEK